jgi:hypothetical protein
MGENSPKLVTLPKANVKELKQCGDKKEGETKNFLDYFLDGKGCNGLFFTFLKIFQAFIFLKYTKRQCILGKL